MIGGSSISGKLEVLVPEAAQEPGADQAGKRKRSIRLRRSLRSFVPEGCILALMAIGLSLLYLMLRSWGVEAHSRVLIIRICTIIPAGYLLNQLRVYFNELYVFKTNVVCHHKGRLALKYSMPFIYYSDIREIKVDQGVLGRIFDYGDVILSTAAKKHEIDFRGVSGPKVIETFLARVRNTRLNQQGREYPNNIRDKEPVTS